MAIDKTQILALFIRSLKTDMYALKHPDFRETDIIVVRNWWQKLFRSPTYATQKEVDFYLNFLALAGYHNDGLRNKNE